MLTRGALLLDVCSRKELFVMISITRIQILEVKQSADRMPTEMYLSYNSVMHLRSAELKGECEMVHGK